VRTNNRFKYRQQNAYLRNQIVTRQYLTLTNYIIGWFFTRHYSSNTSLYNIQTPLNYETVKRLIKEKHKKNFFRKPQPHLERHSGMTLNLHGNVTKTNLEDRQLLTSGSTEVTIASQHTFIASKYPAITTAQYVNRKTIMDKEHLLKCPKLDNTAKNLPKLYWDARRLME